MHISNLITLTYLTALATAVPTRTLIPRADSCAQYATVQTGPYTVSNNLWGEGSATSGSQCMGVDGLSGTTLKWHTRYLDLQPLFHFPLASSISQLTIDIQQKAGPGKAAPTT